MRLPCFKALAEESNETLRDYFFISLLTGARRSNVQEMQWKQLHFDRAEWRIPTTKNGEPQIVTLTPEAVEILRTREGVDPVWVFPGSGPTGHLVEPKKAWKRILEQAGIADLRIHDLRRTLGSWQAKTGASLGLVGKYLNVSSQPPRRPGIFSFNRLADPAAAAAARRCGWRARPGAFPGCP